MGTETAEQRSSFKLGKRFDIAYFVAKMEMPFTTYPHFSTILQNAK